MTIATVASVVGIAGGIGSLTGAFGGSSGGAGSTTGGNPATYIPQGQGQTDNYLQSIIQQLTQGGTSAAGNVQNNPYYGGAQTLSGNIAGLGSGFSQEAFQGGQGLTDYLYGNVLPQTNEAAQQLNGLTGSLIPGQVSGIGGVQGIGQQVSGQQGQYGSILSGLTGQLAGSGLPGVSALQGGANSLLQTGFDPQNALFNQQTQQLQDQVRSSNAAAGVASTPYGAGLENQAQSNFDINWQNQQLARQQSALSGAGSAYGQAGGLGTQALGNYESGISGAAGLDMNSLSSLLSGYTGANSLGTSAIANALAGYGGASAQGVSGLQSLGTAYTGQAGLNSTGLSGLQSSGMLPYQTYAGQQTGSLGALGSLGNLSSVLSQYLGIGQNATSQGLSGQAQQYGQQQNAGSQIGSGLQGLSQLFGGSGASGSTLPTTNPISYTPMQYTY